MAPNTMIIRSTKEMYSLISIVGTAISAPKVRKKWSA